MPLALDIVRYAGEWVAAVVADSRAIAEDAAELVEVDYEPLTPVVDPERRSMPTSPAVHPDARLEHALPPELRLGHRSTRISPHADHTLAFRARWDRSSTVPIETFGVVGAVGSGAATARRLGLDPDAEISRSAGARAAAARQRRARALRRRCRRQLRRASAASSTSMLVGYLARKLGVPVRLIEDRLENMRGGDVHGPDRIFDMRGRLRQRRHRSASLKIRALDDCGAYAGRAPLQLGKPVGAICGPYRIAASNTRRSASRPTRRRKKRCAASARRRPISRSRARSIASRATSAWTGSRCAAQSHPQGRIPLPHSERQHLRLRRLSHRARQGARRRRLSGAGRAARRRRARRALAGIGISTCLEPSGGNSAFEPLFNPKNETTTWMDSCLRQSRSVRARSPASMNTSSSGQGHETLGCRPWSAKSWSAIPRRIRVVRADSLSALPSNSPVGSRMAIMLGGAAAGAAKKIKETLIAIAAHNLGVRRASARISRRRCCGCAAIPRSTCRGTQIVEIAHRKFHQLPAGMEPGLQAKFVLGSADRRRAADRRWPRADVSLLCLRGACRLCRDRSRSPARSTLGPLRRRPRLRHDDQSRHRARHDLWRHRARHRRGALRALPLRRERPVRERHLHGLPDPVGA